MSHHGVMDAYSEDLRRKIVEAVQERRMNQSEAARAFGVSLSSVKRYVKAVREGRSLSPGKAPGKQPTLDKKAKVEEIYFDERLGEEVFTSREPLPWRP
jgi:transposase